MNILVPLYDARMASLLRTSARQVSAAIPPAMIAASLEEHPPGGRTQAFASALVDELRRGGLWSRAARRAKLEPMFVAAFEASETTGRLDVTLDLLAAHVESARREHSKLLRPMIYVIACWLVISLGFPVPLLIMGQTFLWALCTVTLLAAPIGLIAMLGLARAAGIVPGFREVAVLRARARWCRTVAMLSAAGLPLPAILRHAAEAAGIEPVASQARRIWKSVERGGSVLEGAQAEGVLPKKDALLVLDAERTGRLDVAYERAAAWMDEEALRMMEARTTMLSIAVILVLASLTFLAMLWRFVGMRGSLDVG